MKQIRNKGELMEQRNYNHNLKNGLLAAFLVFLLFLLAALRHDFYYELNDDLVIADILSGKYTGMPEAHTNQLLYPLGLLLCLCYKVLPTAPVYPFFLSAAMAISLWMIYDRALSFFQLKKTKISCGILLYLLSLVLFLRQVVLVQYTAVSGILCTAACFWFLTSGKTEGKKSFWKKNLLPLVCYLLAFNLRSEMALLCLPMVGSCGIFRWYEDAFQREEGQSGSGRKSGGKLLIRKQFLLTYFLFFCVILLFMGIFLIVDYFAYGSREWKSFRAFFDARTRVYDYTWYPSYEEEEEFYRKNGISRVQYELIHNYNFGLDQTITADTLEIIADYNEKERNSGGAQVKLKTTIRELMVRFFTVQDRPYALYVLTAYVLVAVLAVLQKRKKEYAEKLFLLWMARNISWFYVLWSQRAVERIIYPLYLMEFFILMAMLVRQLWDRPLWNIERYYRRIVLVVLSLISLPFLLMADRNLIEEGRQREKAVDRQAQLELYTKVHLENYYYLDVYSMVDFTAKIYDRENDRRNYDFLGGWICNSPLQKKAVEPYIEQEELKEVSSYFEESGETGSAPAQALLLENFYVIAKESEDVAFLEKVYKEKGVSVQVEKADEIHNSDNPFVVYRVSRIP